MHCSIEKPTMGCIAIDKTKMIKLFENITDNSIIEIDEKIIKLKC